MRLAGILHLRNPMLGRDRENRISYRRAIPPRCTGSRARVFGVIAASILLASILKRLHVGVDENRQRLLQQNRITAPLPMHKGEQSLHRLARFPSVSVVTAPGSARSCQAMSHAERVRPGLFRFRCVVSIQPHHVFPSRRIRSCQLCSSLALILATMGREPIARACRGESREFSIYGNGGAAAAIPQGGPTADRLESRRVTSFAIVIPP